MRLSKMHNALHTHNVGLGVRMQTHHFNQQWNSTEFNFFWVPCVEYKIEKIV